jgi:outer membrane lipopolysaccharide assembly protein LptE/RlpB
MTRAAAICAVLALAGCGYRVGGKAELVPSTVKTIAIPAFRNVTPRYRLTQMLPGAIGREFITRTRYRVVADPNEADAILSGAVTNYMSAPTISDQATGRAAGLQISVFLNLQLVEKGSGKILYSREGLEVRERYEVSVDQRAYFDESDAALERLSRDVARQVVSSILEAF